MKNNHKALIVIPFSMRDKKASWKECVIENLFSFFLNQNICCGYSTPFAGFKQFPKMSSQILRV